MNYNVRGMVGSQPSFHSGSPVTRGVRAQITAS
jgi:hypothetical protein